MITSVELNGLEIGVCSQYAVHRDSLDSLQSGNPRDPLLTEMQGRPPIFNRAQPRERSITLVVILLDPTWNGRRIDFLALEAAGSSSGLVPLTLTEDGATVTYSVFCGGAVPDGWYYRATISAVAPDPTGA